MSRLRTGIPPPHALPKLLTRASSHLRQSPWGRQMATGPRAQHTRRGTTPRPSQGPVKTTSPGGPHSNSQHPRKAGPEPDARSATMSATKTPSATRTRTATTDKRHATAETTHEKQHTHIAHTSPDNLHESRQHSRGQLETNNGARMDSPCALPPTPTTPSGGPCQNGPRGRLRHSIGPHRPAPLRRTRHTECPRLLHTGLRTLAQPIPGLYRHTTRLH